MTNQALRMIFLAPNLLKMSKKCQLTRCICPWWLNYKMWILLCLLPIPETYICFMLCIACATFWEPKQLLSIIMACIISFLHWYKEFSIVVFLPLHVCAFMWMNKLWPYTKLLKHIHKPTGFSRKLPNFTYGVPSLIF